MTTRKPKLLLVSARWGHLGGHSGLAPLGAALAAHFDVVRTTPTTADKLKVGLRQIVRVARERLLGAPKQGGWSPFYNRNGALLEVAARRMLRAKAYDVVLFEALEDHFDAFADARQWLPRTTRIAGVSHQPPAWWRVAGVDKNVFAAVDTVVALSQEACGFLRDELGHADVHFLPHGVDAAFFGAPGEGAQAHTKPVTDVLFCGQWLRDFRVLRETVETLAAQGEADRFRFHLVVPKFARNFEQHYHLARHANVRWYSGLSDEALRGLYRAADLMFLPLIDATANNSVLEAMAAGLPLVVSRVGGVPDYVGADGAFFIEQETGEHAAAVLKRAAADADGRRLNAQRAQARALQLFPWDVVATDMAGLMRADVATARPAPSLTVVGT